jgi:hypothetical protein
MLTRWHEILTLSTPFIGSQVGKEVFDLGGAGEIS